MKRLLFILFFVSAITSATELGVSALGDYRFRGISQSDLQPGLASQVEYTAGNGLWLGNRLNTISKKEYPGAGLESDYYLGWSHNWGDGVRTYVGNYEYTYPGTPNFNTNEAFVQLRVPYFTVKYYRSLTDYFAAPNTMGTQYVSIDNYIPIQQWSLITHVGRTISPLIDYRYTDWRTSITTNLEGVDLALTYYWNRNLSTQFRILNTADGHALYQNGLVLSVSKTF